MVSLARLPFHDCEYSEDEDEIILPSLKMFFSVSVQSSSKFDTIINKFRPQKSRGHLQVHKADE